MIDTGSAEGGGSAQSELWAMFWRLNRRPGLQLIIIWALGRAPDLHWNIYQLIISSNNGTQKFHTFPTNFQPGQLNKYARHVTVPDSLSLSRRPKIGKT